MPGCMASSTSRIFSATDQRRRRCTEVITSTRRKMSSGRDGELGLASFFVVVTLTSGKAEVKFWDIFGTKRRTKTGKTVFRYIITSVIFHGVRKHNQVVK